MGERTGGAAVCLGSAGSRCGGGRGGAAAAAAAARVRRCCFCFCRCCCRGRRLQRRQRTRRRRGAISGDGSSRWWRRRWRCSVMAAGRQRQPPSRGRGHRHTQAKAARACMRHARGIHMPPGPWTLAWPCLAVIMMVVVGKMPAFLSPVTTRPSWSSTNCRARVEQMGGAGLGKGVRGGRRPADPSHSCAGRARLQQMPLASPPACRP